jgi:predicted nucleic-acid-binding Zn-ribbon protein
MKNTLKCPKCAGKKIWLLERYRIPGESAAGRELAVVPHQDDGKTGLFRSLSVSPQGHFDLFLCNACGYSELWAGGFEDLVPSPERGIRLIDSGDAGAGPFR